LQTARLIVRPDPPAEVPRPRVEVPARYRLARGRLVPAELTAAARQVEATVSYDPGSSKIAIFAVNRDPQQAVRLRAMVRDVRIVRVLKHDVLDGIDPDKAPSRAAHGAALDDDGLGVVLAPASWTVVHLAVTRRPADQTRYAS
jgi:alpha-L-arabinofuranosidase